MPGETHTGVMKVREALEARGFASRVVALDRTARSATEAAATLGCRVEQIVLVGGANRVDEGKISDLISEPVEKADADYVREKTGFSIGGVPPVGHAERPVTFVDEDLLREEEIWASAGHTHAVFKLDPTELLEMTGGLVVAVK